MNAVTDAAKAAYAASPIPELPAGQFNPPGGVLFAGPNHRNVYSTEHHDVQPALGFAWTPEAWAARP